MPLKIGDKLTLTIHDIADTNLVSPTVYAFPDNPGAPTDNGAAPGGEDWKWTVPGPLQPGATSQFDVEFTLGPGVQPMQSLVNGSTVTWASLPGCSTILFRRRVFIFIRGTCRRPCF